VAELDGLAPGHEPAEVDTEVDALALVVLFQLFHS
jgi:hypothetical protein